MSGSRGTGAPGARARPRRDAAPASCPLPCPLPGLPPRSRPCPPGCFRVYINKPLAAAGFRVLNKLRARARAQPGLHSRPQDRAVRGTSPPLSRMPGPPLDPAQLLGSPPPRGTSVSRRMSPPRRIPVPSPPAPPPQAAPPSAPQRRHCRHSPSQLGERNSLGVRGRSRPKRRAGGAGAASWTRRRDSQPVPGSCSAWCAVHSRRRCPGSCCFPAPGKRPRLLD